VKQISHTQDRYARGLGVTRQRCISLCDTMSFMHAPTTPFLPAVSHALTPVQVFESNHLIQQPRATSSTRDPRPSSCASAIDFEQFALGTESIIDEASWKFENAI
jgi:hypothetical protein